MSPAVLKCLHGTSSEHTDYDFACFYISEWTSEMEAAKLKLQAECGIFVAPRVTETHDDEYPEP